MAYSETRIVIGGLAHVPVLIFIANFIKGKFVIKTEKAKETFASWVIISNLPLMKFAIKIRTGTWARPPITILVSE